MSARRGHEDGSELHEVVLEAWLRTQPSANTRAAYRTDLNMFGTWCVRNGSIPLCADAATLLEFQRVREAAGDSASTLRRRWSALSSFYDFAVERHAAAANPADGASRPKVLAGDPSPTTLLSTKSVDEYRALAAELDPRLDALVSLLVHDGLKLGEALALDVDDVVGRPPRMSINIRRNGAVRKVALVPDSARAVYRCAGRRRAGPLFTSARPASPGALPHRLTRFGADHLFKRLNTGDDGRVTANTLRRFHFTSSQHAGADLDSVRERAGLADIRSLRRYLVGPDATTDATVPESQETDD